MTQPESGVDSANSSTPADAAPDTANGGFGDNAYLNAILGVEEEENAPATTMTHVSASGTKHTLPKKKSGIFGTSSNLVNSIVGAGIIGIPYAFRQSGLVAGVLLLILVAVLTDKSLRLIVEMASFHPELKQRGVFTYEDLAAYPFGKFGSGFVLFNMFVLAYGAMVAYLLIIKDTVPTILDLDNGIEREIVLIITSLLIVVPLSMQRDMASLSFTSLLSVTADAVLVVFVAAYAPIKETVGNAGGFGEVLKNDWINGTLFIGLGILSTAMACQHSAFIVSGSLANLTRIRWAAVTYRSLFVSTVLCLVLGICGYLGFLDETMGDVLNNFDPDSLEANAARALLAITMFFTYPMESFVARHVLIKLIHNGDMDGEDIAVATEEGQENGATMPTRPWYILRRREKWTLAIYVGALIPALIVNDLGPVLSITGSLGGSCVSYIAPGMVYLGVHGQDFLVMVGAWLQNRQQKRSHAGATGDIELPVAGDSTQVLQSSQVAPESALEGSKPWWFYLGLFPLWCWIARTGSANMREKLRLATPEATPMPRANIEVNDVPTDPTDEDDAIVARGRDFFVAMFFVVFGIVAAVAGVGSNVYVQVNNVFFTPH